MAWALTRYLWKLPNAYPTASTVISGIVGIIGAIYGIALMGASAHNGQSAVAAGLLLILLGGLIAGLAVYAAYDTNNFHNWSRPDGNYGHGIIRWLGPICIILAIIEFIVALWIISLVLEGMSKG